jgi:hypothetical protein
VIYSRAWLGYREVSDFNRLAPYTNVFVPRLSSLSAINHHPIPSPGSIPTLYDAAIERAQELKASRVTFYVPLSGGVDSSMVAAALAKVGTRPVIGLSVTGATYSDPVFLEWLQSQGCTIEPCDQTSIKAAVERDLHVVTGTHGDNLFTGDCSFKHGLVDDVWHMTPNEVLQVLSSSEGDLWARYGYLFAEMPVKPSAANVLWWVGFAGHWSADCYYLTADLEIGAPGVTHSHFFDSLGFQRWMMQDTAVRCGKSYDTVKEQGIRTVSELVGRTLNIPTKTKGWEDIRPMSYKPTLLKIDENWTFVRTTL